MIAAPADPRCPQCREFVTWAQSDSGHVAYIPGIGPMHRKCVGVGLVWASRVLVKVAREPMPKECA